MLLPLTIEHSMSTIDWVIIAVYLVGIVIFGLYMSKKNETSEEYFLAGRSMTWPIVGFTLYAANMGSPALVGLAESAYKTGISVFNYEWMAAVVLVFFAIFILPFYLRSRVYTMPEFLEKRYGRGARLYFSFITLILNIVVDTAAVLYTGALIAQFIFPNVDLWIIIAAISIATAAYTVSGGLSAVLYTEVVQAVLLLVGCFLVTYFAFEKIDFNWELVKQNAGPDKLSLIRPNDDAFLPWFGLITGVPIVGFYFWCTNQFMVQRVLSAKDTNHGRWGALFAGALKLPVLFFMVIPGTIAITLYPNLEKAADVYPTLLFDLLPVGILGLVMAALIAAISSSVSATLNSAATLVTMDFITPFNPGMSEKKKVRIGQIFTFVFVVLSALWAPQIANFGSLFEYLQEILAYFTPPVVAVFLMGIFWEKTNYKAAITALSVGFFMMLGVFYVKYYDPSLFPLLAKAHFMIVAAILLLVSAIILAVVSLFTIDKNPKDKQDLIWTFKVYKKESEELQGISWYKNYRILGVLLLLATGILIYFFR